MQAGVRRRGIWLGGLLVCVDFALVRPGIYKGES
jgi:hypothetical protein